MNFNLKQLEALVWVADLGSFRKAGERLNTTQPNISARIAALEATLGVKLMNRDAASIRLTSKGEEILVHARNTLEQARKIMVSADRTVLHDGTLKIGVTELIAHTWLREFLRRLREAYPNIVVELTVDLSVNLKSELFSRSIDLAFQNGPFQNRTSGMADLGTYEWIWVAAPTLEICTKDNPTLQDLLKHPILTHARDTKPYRDIAEYFSAKSKAPARLVPSSNLATCLYMAIDGLGIAALPAIMVKRELEAGELQAVPHSWVPEPLHFQARYDKKKSPKFVELAANLAAQISQEQPFQ